MATFTDKDGERWELSVSFRELVGIKKEFGLCLIDLTDEDRKANRSKADVSRLAGDVELFVNVVHWLCRGQAEQRKLTAEDFAGRLLGEPIFEAMTALEEELTVFSLPRTQHERVRELAQKRGQAIAERAAQVLGRTLERALAVSPEELNRLEAEILASAGSDSAASASAGSSPALSG